MAQNFKLGNMDQWMSLICVTLHIKLGIMDHGCDSTYLRGLDHGSVNVTKLLSNMIMSVKSGSHIPKEC